MRDRHVPPDELFDRDFYCAQIGQDLDVQAAVQHFLAHGDQQGLDPSPYFATRAYKLRYPDWNRQGAATAVADFLMHCKRGEPRQPHPMFDAGFYCSTYPDLAGLGGQAARHFIRHGDAEGRSPSADFDATFYRQCYLPLGATHPFRHYVTRGAALGYLPRPVSRTAGESRAAMQRALAAFARPLLLVAHDAQAAGVPILTLDLAWHLRARGWNPVFMLGRAGPLLADMQALGPVLVLAEGWETGGLAAGLPRGTPALVTTSAAAKVARRLAEAQACCLVLIHEMAEFIRGQGFLPDLRAAEAAGAELIVSMPRMATALRAELGDLRVIQPGIALPETSLAAFRRLRKSRGKPSGPVFIGAGYADRRKGFDLFLEAAMRIAAMRPQAGFIWLGELDVWAQQLAEQAQRAGLDLTLPGFVADSPAWYRMADVYLLTSRQDPGPTTAIHAAAMGLPFVGYAADIGLIGLTDGVGHFLPSGDEAGFATMALDLAERRTTASRRHLRRYVRRQTGFDGYVDAILDRFACLAGG